MKPSTPWSRHSRHHHIPTPGAAPEDRYHHPRGHVGRAFSDSPHADGGGRRHHPPFGGGPGGRPGGPFGGGPEGPFGGGPRGGRRGGRHGRAGRGDVRSALLLLLADEPMHGYQLMQAVAERTGGAWKLSPGAVYPTIAQLEDEGLVRISAEGGRKLVTLTEAGREHLTALGTSTRSRPSRPRRATGPARSARRADRRRPPAGPGRRCGAADRGGPRPQRRPPRPLPDPGRPAGPAHPGRRAGRQSRLTDRARIGRTACRDEPGGSMVHYMSNEPTSRRARLVRPGPA